MVKYVALFFSENRVFESIGHGPHTLNVVHDNERPQACRVLSSTAEVIIYETGIVVFYAT